jgi:hypothetical protein
VPDAQSGSQSLIEYVPLPLAPSADQEVHVMSKTASPKSAQFGVDCEGFWYTNSHRKVKTSSGEISERSLTGVSLKLSSEL